jgi:hypothetical protein
MKLVLLWRHSDQDLNSKDIEDFLLFPTGIHTPSYDQWFRRYALSKLMNAAGILRWTDWSELTILNCRPKIINKNSRTLNTKHVDIFLRFPSNICVPCSDKQSNNYGHWRTTWGEILTEIQKQIKFSKMKDDLVQERNQDKQLKKGEWFTIIPGWIACGSQNEEHGVAESSWWWTTIGKEWLDRLSMKVGKIFSDEGCSLELTDLKSWFPWLFKLGSWCRVKMMIGN